MSPEVSPAPTAEATVSPEPATTGVPARRPVSFAAASVTWPATSAGPTIFGSPAGSKPSLSQSSSDQRHGAHIATSPESEAFDGSVTNSPVSRATANVFAKPRTRAPA